MSFVPGPGYSGDGLIHIPVDNYSRTDGLVNIHINKHVGAHPDICMILVFTYWNSHIERQSTHCVVVPGIRILGNGGGV